MVKYARNLRGFVNNKNTVGYLFILPSFLILVSFLIILLVVTIIFSFFKFSISLSDFKFIGLQQFFRTVQDGRFWNSLFNTMYFTAIVVPCQVIISLLVSIAINKKSRYNLFLRNAYFLPVVVSMTVVSLMFVFLLNPNLGGIAPLLKYIGIQPIDWLKSTTWAMPTVIVVTVFKNFGMTMVIILAALQGVPDHYYEAAELDGANGYQRFRNITLPMIMPTLTFVSIITILGSFQVFDQVYIMTGGGPLNKTETMVQYIYYQGFQTYVFLVR